MPASCALAFARRRIRGTRFGSALRADSRPRRQRGGSLRPAAHRDRVKYPRALVVMSVSLRVEHRQACRTGAKPFAPAQERANHLDELAARPREATIAP